MAYARFEFPETDETFTRKSISDRRRTESNTNNKKTHSTLPSAMDSGELRISHLSYDNRTNVKFEHDRLNRSQVPSGNLAICVAAFRSSSVIYRWRNIPELNFSGFPLRNSDAFVALIQQSFVIAAPGFLVIKV